MKEGFLWGGALSNVQAEGAYLEQGKGLNVYDTLTVKPEPGIMSQYCDTAVAVDHYHQYQQDIDLMAEMGFKAYRFSIVWSRIHPQGIEDEPNEAGLAYYEAMIDYLLAKGIEPVVSLVHFDMPDYLAVKYNGFWNKKVIDLYQEHVRTVVARFQGKVKYWITYNEINLAPFMPELVAGAKKPVGMPDNELFVRLVINTQLAHARAVLTIKEIDAKAKVGGMVAYTPIQPGTSRSEDLIAVDYTNKLRNYLGLDIMTSGELPAYFLDFMQKRAINYSLSEKEKNYLSLAAEKLDYLAFSYYQSVMCTNIVSLDINDTLAQEDALLWGRGFSHNPLYPANEWQWTIDPKGLLLSLIQLKDRYHKPLFIVENGIGIDEVLKGGKVYDDKRIAYHQGHIYALKKAVEYYGVDLIGYLVWSPIDFLSAHKEIRKRYGFVYVDRTFDDLKQLKRYPKKSFYWYQKVIASNGNDLENNLSY